MVLLIPPPEADPVPTSTHEEPFHRLTWIFPLVQQIMGQPPRSMAIQGCRESERSLLIPPPEADPAPISTQRDPFHRRT
jgi:hypothetical protein